MEAQQKKICHHNIVVWADDFRRSQTQMGLESVRESNTLPIREVRKSIQSKQRVNAKSVTRKKKSKGMTSQSSEETTQTMTLKSSELHEGALLGSGVPVQEEELAMTEPPPKSKSFFKHSEYFWNENTHSCFELFF